MRAQTTKDRRAYRRYAPLFFMLLEIAGVLEVLYIGYLMFGAYNVYKIIAISLFIAFFLASYTKMNQVYHRSWHYLKTRHSALA